MEETSSGSPIKQQQEQIDYSADPVPTLLPENFEEILLRLPVKSLLKFRCVSKSWLSLISSPKFRKSHLEISTNDPDLTFHRIMFSFMVGFPNMHTYSVRSLLYEPMIDDVTISHPGRDLDSYFRLHGSCNGLICISIGKQEDLFLWNPSLRKSKKLPDIDDTLLGTCIWKLAVYGFGFDETNDDYKVLGVFYVNRDDGPETVACIYNLKTNSWRRIEGFNIHAAGDPFIFVQGKLHWSVSTGVQNKWKIASFDLGNETYGTVEQPNYWKGNFYPILGVLGGCICMICNSEEFCTDVWVLEDFHVKESWTKFASIPLSCDYCTPLCISPYGDVLLVHGLSFIVYNGKENSLMFPQIGDVFQSSVYVESLISPEADGD